MLKLTFSINLDNAIFADDASSEIARIFQDLANFAKETTLSDKDLPLSKPLKDFNGNKIGYLKITK
tara:strand:+ start:177 stop:374 length:198 start_codon:yes stop_codon:yes gene_type:complete